MSIPSWFFQQWSQGKCTGCQTTFWVCDGDPSDFTAYVPDGLICWKCGHKMYRASGVELELEYGLDWKNEVDFETTKERP